MNKRTLAVIAFLSVVSVANSSAQDVAKVNPDTVIVKLDNERVRVLEAELKPGAKENQHSHPSSIIYVLSAGTIRSHSADGKVTEATFKAGDVIYREPLTHWSENIGETTVRMLLVELKSGR